MIDGFSCVRGSETLVLPHGTQRLIALLGLADGPLSRQAVSFRLWPAVERQRALGALRTTVWRLRRVCPGMIITDGSLRLRLDAEVDVRVLLAEATSLLKGGRCSSSELRSGELISVFRSFVDLLPGWYDDWVLFHRQRLLAIRVEVLRSAAAQLSADGHLTEALDLALAALVSEPLDEETHMLVASIHLAQGNASEALRQYRLCSELFAHELGVSPSARFRSLVSVVPARPGAVAVARRIRGGVRAQNVGRAF